MNPHIRMLDDSHALVSCSDHNHAAMSPLRRLLNALRDWWHTPLWVRAFPVLVGLPVLLCGYAVTQSLGRLTMALGHKPWLSNQDPGLIISGLMLVVPILLFVFGMVSAPVVIAAAVTSQAIKRRSELVDRARGVCLACRYEFGRLPASTIPDRGTWVICPECGAAWDSAVGNGELAEPRRRASYRSLLTSKVPPIHGPLKVREKAAIALPLVPMTIGLALLAAHAYVLLRPDIAEWIMKYQSGTYWTLVFLPSFVPVAYLLISSLVVGGETVARLIPPASTTPTPFPTPRST